METPHTTDLFGEVVDALAPKDTTEDDTLSEDEQVELDDENQQDLFEESDCQGGLLELFLA